MWLFRRKRIKQESQISSPSCPYCESTNTRLIVYHGTDQPNHVKVWRGQRSLTYRCLDCGLDFYAKEPQGGVSDEILVDNQIIDDEEALRANVGITNVTRQLLEYWKNPDRERKLFFCQMEAMETAIYLTLYRKAKRY